MLTSTLPNPITQFQAVLSEPIISLLYFFWLDLSYQLLFYLVLYLIIVSFQPYQLKLNFFIFFIFFLYNSGLEDFFTLNYYLNYTDYSNFPNNNLLTNCLNKYHPLLFFTSLILLFYLFSQRLSNFLIQSSYTTSSQLTSFFKFRYKIIFFNWVSLFLGSWWALQEWSWGGWWNWDPSETFGLIPGAIFIILSHLFLSVKVLRYFKFKLFHLTNLFLISIFTIQLNFELLSHNFGLKFFHFFNENLGKIFIILTVVLFIISVSRLFFIEVFFMRTKKVSVKNLTTSKTPVPFFFMFSLVIIILTTLFLNLSQILNFSFWKFLNLNLNFWTGLQKVLALTFIYLFLLVKPSLTFNRNLVVFFFIPYVQNIFFLSYFFLSVDPISKLHLISAWSAMVNQISLEKDFFNWSFLYTPYQIVSDNILLQEQKITFNLTGGLIEFFLIWKDNLFSSSLAYQTHTNSFENPVNQYLLVNTHVNTINLQSLSFNQFSFFLSNFLHGLNALVFTVIVISFLIFKKNKLNTPIKV